MNLILFEPEEFQPDGTVTLADGRAEHIRKVLKVSVGDMIRTGTVNGLAGTSRILEIAGTRVRLAPEHTQAVAEPWFDLLLAAPRPKVLKRLWPQLAALGVRQVVVLNAFKVEKCYFSSQWLNAAHYRPLLIEGLMQAGVTRLPQVSVRPRFRPFVEDELEGLFPTTVRLLAHPGLRHDRPVSDGARAGCPLLAVGPEGGWTAYETAMLEAHGFTRFSLGTRILRTDTACVALVATLACLLRGFADEC